MPEGVQELNYNFWTALTRRSCVGNIQTCFNNLSFYQKNATSTYDLDGLFGKNGLSWKMFDRTDSGACVALQTLPFGMNQFEGSKNSRFDSGPVFKNCKDLNYFACEMEGGRAKFIDETELVVSSKFSKQYTWMLSHFS